MIELIFNNANYQNNECPEIILNLIKRGTIFTIKFQNRKCLKKFVLKKISILGLLKWLNLMEVHSTNRSSQYFASC